MSVLRESPTRPAQARGDDFICAYSLNAPTIDGTWTSENEWMDATEFNGTENSQSCVFRLKHDGYRLFILVDLACATANTSVYTEVLVGIDVNCQGGVAPQSDDYLFRMLFTSESYGITETILYSQGNEIAWVKPKYFLKISPVAGFGVGNFSAGKSPYSSVIHWICEMEISLKFLEAREAYGFYISAYYSYLNALFALPKNGSIERPDSWGRLVGFRFPDLSVAKIWIGDASGKWIFPKPEQEYYFWVLVKNIGTASAFDFKLSFRIIHEDYPQHLEMYSGFLESTGVLNSTRDRRFALYVPAMYSWLRRLGEHQVRVAVNEDRSTPELNYKNNELVKNFLVDYGHILRVRLPYQGLTVKIDGHPYVTDENGEVGEALLQGRHVVEVPGVTFPLYGVEITFLRFSDGYNATSRPFNLNDDIVFDVKYTVRYLLEVESKHGVVSGAGWIPAGAIANLSVAPLIDLGNSTRVVLVKWVLPENVTHFGDTAKVRMDGPRKVQIVWKRQFLLSVRSEYGSPKGSGWYDQGSLAFLEVEEVWGVVVVHTFREWTGDVRAVTAKASVVMDSPKEATALWTTDYTRLYIVLAYIAAMALFAVFIAYRARRQRRMKPPVRRRRATPGQTSLTPAPH